MTTAVIPATYHQSHQRRQHRQRHRTIRDQHKPKKGREILPFFIACMQMPGKLCIFGTTKIYALENYADLVYCNDRFWLLQQQGFAASWEYCKYFRRSKKRRGIFQFEYKKRFCVLLFREFYRDIERQPAGCDGLHLHGDDPGRCG